jgi:hypothetical protein
VTVASAVVGVAELIRKNGGILRIVEKALI